MKNEQYRSSTIESSCNVFATPHNIAVRRLLYVIVFLIHCFVLDAQPDSVAFDTSNLAPSTIKIEKKHSPGLAALYSAALPGLGQVYNKQVWKVPIIYAAAAGITYFAIKNGRGKEKFKNEYYRRINGDSVNFLPDYLTYTNEGIYNLYSAYNTNFQLSLIVGGVFYALNILDAYVYGHLFYFNLTDDLTMNIRPYCSIFQNSSLGISIGFNFLTK